MGCIPLRGKSHRHDRHEPTARGESLGGADQMLCRDMPVARPIDRGGEGWVHHNDARKIRCGQEVVDMLRVMAGHLDRKDRLEQGAAERIDLVEHRLTARAQGKTCQRAGAG